MKRNTVVQPEERVSEVSLTDQILLLIGQGLTNKQISEQLGTSTATVRVVASRMKEMTAEDMAKRMAAITPTSTFKVALTERQNGRLAAIAVSTEEKTAKVTDKALETVEAALESVELDMRTRAWVAIEFLKTRKATGSITVNQQTNVQQVNTTPEDAHGRLNELAARIQTGSRKILPSSIDGGEGEE